MMNYDKFRAQIADSYDWLAQYAKFLCRHHQEAMDLRGETIIKALENWDRHNPECDFKSWLATICIRSYLTARNRRRYYFLFRDKTIALNKAHNASDGVYDTIFLNQVLEKVKKDEVLLFARGYSYQEIATMRNIPIGTIRSRISNERKRLRKLLDELNI